MPKYLRNSKYNRLFLLIGIGAAVFISFQLLSLRILSSSAHIASKDLLDDIEERDLNDDDPILNNEKEKHAVLKIIDKGEKTKNINPLKESQLIGYKNHLKGPHPVIRGVNLDEAELYTPDNNQMFSCLKTKEQIPFSAVNDDYCDCDDNTDEPGTSACDGKFYCTKQFPNQALIVLPSNRVNDGICDCCDGSDEWKKTGPREGVIPAERSKLKIQYAPCKDTCEQIIQSNKDDERIHSMGKRLKRSYLNAAKHLPERNIYGPQGVFYKLSKVCFTHKVNEYEYEVCPFRKVVQESFPNHSFNLGKISEWIHQTKGRYVLQMSGGESHLCPDGLGRMCLITFLCGLSDRVISLQEDEKCVYGIKFSTPAAC